MFDLNIRLVCVLVYFIVLVLWLWFLKWLLVGFYVVVMFSRLMKKLLLSMFRWLVNMLCWLLLKFVLRMCRLFIRVVIFGVVRVSSWVLFISRCLVGVGMLGWM